MTRPAILAPAMSAVSTKSFELSSQKLNNSGISADPTLSEIKRVSKMKTLLTNYLHSRYFSGQFFKSLRDTIAEFSITEVVSCQPQGVVACCPNASPIDFGQRWTGPL
jgi:hypothetical protein